MTLLAAGVLVAFALVPGQAASGVVSGVIADTAGNPLPGALVLLVADSGDQQPRTAIADANGYYRFDQLIPGRYRAEARMAGFLTKPTNVVVASGARVTWGGALLVGDAPDGRSIERQILRFTGSDAVDCGRYHRDTVGGTTLQRAVDCAMLAARSSQPFSFIVQHPTSNQWEFGGLVAAADGEIHAFTYRTLDGKFETRRCPNPTVPLDRNTVRADATVTCGPSERVNVPRETTVGVLSSSLMTQG